MMLFKCKMTWLSKRGQILAWFIKSHTVVSCVRPLVLHPAPFYEGSMQHCCIPAASCVSVPASQPQGSVEKSLPPVHSRHPGAAREGDSRRPDRRKDAEVWRHPDIPLRDAIFLPALDEDNWQAPRQSPRKPSAHGSPQLWGRGRSQPPKVAIQPQRDEPSPGQDGSNRSAPPPSRAAPGAPNKLLRPPPVLAPGAFSGFRSAFDFWMFLKY